MLGADTALAPCMSESNPTRLAQIRADVLDRLKDACACMAPVDFEAMVTHMAEIHYRYEQQRNDNGDQRNAAALEEVAVPLVAMVEPSAEDADGERERRLWVNRPVSVMLPREPTRDRKGHA